MKVPTTESLLSGHTSIWELALAITQTISLSECEFSHGSGRMAMEKTRLLYEKFLDEYVSEDAVRKYTTQTAGYGITYLLRNEYARIYLNVVESCLRTSNSRPLRLL